MQALPFVHSDTAANLNSLAYLYQVQGHYAGAESLLQRALTIYEEALSSDLPHTATTLQSLARLYRDQGRFAEAEPPFQRSLTIKEQVLGHDHLDTGITLQNEVVLHKLTLRQNSSYYTHQECLDS